MHRGKKERKIIIFSLVGILICMVVAYATLSTNIQTTGSSKITSSWDIQITNVTAGTPTGGAENAKTPTHDGLTASMEANLYSKGDAMEYDVTITNNGTLDAKLDNIITNAQNANEEAVIITFTGYKKGEVLKSKESKIVHVKIAYNPDYNGDETSSEVDLTFDFVQDNKDPSEPQTYMLTYDYETNGGTRADSEGEFLTAGTTVDLTNKAYKNGWKFVGWNTNKDAKEPLSSFEMTASNTTLYAIFKKDAKTITLTFNKNGADSQTPSSGGASSNDAVKETCTIPEVYNNEVQDTTCNITAPAITPATGFIALGYESAADSTTASWTQNVAKAVNTDMEYYAITQSESPYTATFDQNGATSISSATESCYRYNGKESCNITTPTIVRDGFNIAGWGEEATSTSATVNQNSALALNKNATYYAITSKEVNVTYQKGSNIESIGAESGKCTIQNNNSTCQVTLPSITPVEGFLSVGWNTQNGATTGTPEGSNLTLSNDATYYANAIDNVGPEITLEPNTQSTFISGGKAINVTITDSASGLKAGQTISYAWSASKDTPPTYTNTVTTTNVDGEKSTQITIPENISSTLTGSYYLWIKEGISDVNGNTSTYKVSEVFKFDNTDPTLTISTTATTNSITAVANADAASGISKYEFSINGGSTWIDNGTSNTYRFTNLNQGTSYPISVRVTSGVGKITQKDISQGIDPTEDPTTSGDGLYADEYEEGKYTYKGANPNNYVTFNNEKAGWRIISINSDGTIKIMKDGNIGDIAWDESNSNNWNRPASLNTYLNNDYYNSLTSTSQSQIVEGTYYAGAVTRGNNDMQDQISDEKAVTSKVKVALPTVSEYLRANSNKEQCGTFSLNNSNYSTCKNSNWMYINDLWWTLSPYSGISGGVFSVNSGGYVNYNFATITNYAVRPAITLSSEVQITGGTGTQSDPYTLGGGVSTAELEKPTYTDEGLFPKTVTIHFPEGCADGSLTCSYQQDNGQSVNVTQTSVELNYEQNGNIVASVSDGVNTVTSSYTVKIELRAVDLSYDNANTGMDCAETQCALDTIKKMLE